MESKSQTTGLMKHIGHLPESYILLAELRLRGGVTIMRQT